MISIYSEECSHSVHKIEAFSIFLSISGNFCLKHGSCCYEGQSGKHLIFKFLFDLVLNSSMYLSYDDYEDISSHELCLHMWLQAFLLTRYVR